MAMDSRMAMTGMMMKALPSWAAMEEKGISTSGSPVPVPLTGMKKSGRRGEGIPPGISPVRVKVQASLLPPCFSSQREMSGSRKPEMTAIVTTTRAFLAVQRNQTAFLTTASTLGDILEGRM